MPDRALIWLGGSRADLRAFPALARRLVGFQLRRVQQGLDPDELEADANGWSWSSGDPDSCQRRASGVLRGDAP